MLFNSIVFILFFLPVFLILWYALKPVKMKLFVLTAMSFLFYGYWDYRFLGLMVISILIDYYSGEKISYFIQKNQKKNAKKWMYFSIISNLSILGFFKYFNFFTDSLFAILPDSFLESKPAIEIVLPVGISFYTFQTMTYSIDLYRGEARKVDSFLHFSAYVSMFPQLIAGPIVRYSDVDEQLANIQSKINYQKFIEGVQYFTIGLFRKLFIADFFAGYADLFFSGSYEFKFIGAWIGLLSYTFQIYFDFSAYSEMAIGLGKMFGFEFPINFNSPYKAKSFSDFWNRWHITLSRFLRDYLYIPLGGNRNGNVKTYVNLSLTMLIGGLWHGASWLFVIWGALHGLYLTLERLISRERLESIFGYRIIVFIAVCIAWIFFRSENLDFALKVLESCFLMNGIESMESSYTVMSFGIPEFVRTYGGFAVLAAISGTLILVNFFPNAAQIKSRTGYLYLFCMTLILVYCLLHVDKPSPFLYFQF